MTLAVVLALLQSQPKNPLEFAKRHLDSALGSAAASVEIKVQPGQPAESFTIETEGGKTTIFAPDQVGAMYGAFEVAEQIANEGKPRPTKQQPYLKDRGLNLFLNLPWDYAKNDSDYDPAALTDPNRWWFHNEDYWTTLLDIMAESRLNWLDIHGTYDISVTDFPNLYAYFVTSQTFPKVGVSSEIKEKNLRQLNHIVEMAHARGIRVSLMSYEAKLTVPHNRAPGYDNTEQNAYTYTKEVVTEIIKKVPGLDAIGFRIGESGRGESFFNCYTEAVKASGREIPLITRSWITRKQKVLPLARANKDFTVEIKYNGEHWGAPYMVAGGRVANWYSYSFEDYLSDSGNQAQNTKTWPGNPIPPLPSAKGEGAGGEGQTEPSSSLPLGGGSGRGSSVSLSRHSNAQQESDSGAGGGLARGQAQTEQSDSLPPGGGLGWGSNQDSERWPDQPYKIVWQVRANGTHRIFPFYNPEWVRRTIGCMKIGTASGYTIEGLDAYFPKSPDYYLADPSKKAYTWIHQRDRMYWMTWGRLGYDPTVPESTFDNEAVRSLGEGTESLVKAWKDASVLMPWAFMAYSLGPDHRSHAPELEWGGDTNAYVQGAGFDTHSFLPINEVLANRATGGTSGRVRSDDFSHVSSLAFDPFSLGRYLATDSPRQRELTEQLKFAIIRFTYTVGRFKSALEAATVEAQYGDARRDVASQEALSIAEEVHRGLSSNTFYRPFTDRLRMHTNAFTWSSEHTKIVNELVRLKGLPEGVANPDPTLRLQPPNSDLLLTGSFHVITSPDKIVCKFVSGDAERVWLLVKPLPSSTYFHRIPMTRNSDTFTVEFRRENYGHMVAVEAWNGTVAARFPDVRKETPYRIVPSMSGPTPQIYSAEEAMTYLKPEVIDPAKHGAMIIGTRGWRFFSSFDTQTRRKLLDPVSRGMKLLILQQDFNRYKLDFLPKPLKIEGGNWTTFDPAGQLGLEKTDTADVMWQRFAQSEGWEVFGNGGIARLKHGKGEVWVVSARFMQRMYIPSAARNFVKLLGIGGKDKPTILIDSNSEGADFSSSNHPDLMNSHGIPFLTLGEVIAIEQGMDSFTPVPGPSSDDDILGGKGREQANEWLRKQVVAKAKRTPPTSREAFEEQRAARKRELLRSLGLDPMPEKTPLNARTTGTLLRRGYRIEKIVYESRPGFYVTAHVYAPYPPPNRRAPVIVNVNGHWAHKKNEDRIQYRAAFQALRGFIALCIDSPGWSFEGNSLIERRAEGDHNDPYLVQGGTNATGYYVWDVIRGLDYLASRADTEMANIGITGASGGGLATLYAFAADDRFDVAVPVVYMASMELAPDNGCLCNHVPGTMQIGDRSDVIAIQAPKPVFVIGAGTDPEFPPNAMAHTIRKMKAEWALFEKDNVVFGQIFPGPHDYSQPMREAAMGFFDHYLRGTGTGSPVTQPVIDVIDPENRSLLVLDPPKEGEKTMRDLAIETLKAVKKDLPVSRYLEVNGGLPARTSLNWREQGEGAKRRVTFESEPGFVTPGVLFVPPSPRGARIVLDDLGKHVRTTDDKADGLVHFYMDPLGAGELKDIELRYPIYLGRAVPFIAAWQIVRAREALAKYGPVEIEAHGPLSSMAAMYACLIEGSFSRVVATGALEAWEDVFLPGVPAAAVQPRANLLPPLERMRAQVKNANWTFVPRPDPPNLPTSQPPIIRTNPHFSQGLQTQNTFQNDNL